VDEHDRDEGPLDGALLVDGAREDDDASFDEDGKADYAKEILEGILDRMGLLAEVEIREDDEQVVLDVTGEDAGRAIGKKGQTLDALQFIVNKVVNRFPENRPVAQSHSKRGPTRRRTAWVQLSRRVEHERRGDGGESSRAGTWRRSSSR